MLAQVVASIWPVTSSTIWPERGEAVVAVDPLGAGLDLLRQASAVVLTEGHNRAPRRPRPRRVEQVGQPPPVADSGVCVRRWRRVAGWRSGRTGRQPESGEVVVCRRVEVDPAPLPQLHDRDGGDRLGERADPEHGVFGDRLSSRHVGDAVAVEPGRLAVTDDGHRQTCVGQRFSTSATFARKAASSSRASSSGDGESVA